MKTIRQVQECVDGLAELVRAHASDIAEIERQRDTAIAQGAVTARDLAAVRTSREALLVALTERDSNRATELERLKVQVEQYQVVSDRMAVRIESLEATESALRDELAQKDALLKEFQELDDEDEDELEVAEG